MGTVFPPQSIVDIQNRIAAGETTPRQALAESARRIDADDEELRAFVARAPLPADVPVDGPLRGIAVGVKDLFDTFDLPTTYGSPIYRDHQPRADAAIVAQVRGAGGWVAGKTATTEFAAMNPAATRNPHDRLRSPGGSSSGSAAAVAAGFIPVALGTQTAGSIIRPAAYCGIAGLKPSFRLLPTVGVKTFAWSLDTVGLFAPSARDVARFAGILSRRPLDHEAGLDIDRLRLGIYRSGIYDQLDPAMADALRKGARVGEELGWFVRDVEETESLRTGREIQAVIQDYEGAMSLLDERTRHRGEISPALLQALDRGGAIEATRYDEARRSARRARRATAELFDNVDLILAPSASGVAPLLSEGSTGDPAFNRLWTLAGTPCINVPGLRAPNGLPLGLTLVARFGGDRLLLAGAVRFEAGLRRT
ncbi:amidase [Aureimonas pseudogalii]|uniref:Asp-tRNA(Asn)/Glu-tRNA(Gln) amidotransferase A subunit family amidase n=1 Tax=Aureimonas pseudogalii TaxID=1744844 RepID=A0A7W6EB59_9HYPH|nr:amidase [Aureimonas pseudogalii]MBB3998121.1 Asp-tRNA(Asn)/Glu-tRNA(Gln) amidotransferase A subunit family amidase [Aureimonas pseudogalii]